MSTGWGRGPRGGCDPRRACTYGIRTKEVHKENAYGSNVSSPFSSPTSARSFPARGDIDMSTVPSRLKKLQRSPEHKVNEPQIWTTGLNGDTSYTISTNPTKIILTDVAVNRPPDLILQSPRQTSQSSISLYSPRSQAKSSLASPTSRRNSNIPQISQNSLFTRILRALRFTSFCWKPPSQSSSRNSSFTNLKSRKINEKGILRTPAETPRTPITPTFKIDLHDVGDSIQSENGEKETPTSFQESESSSRNKNFTPISQDNTLKIPNQDIKPHIKLGVSRSLLDLQRDKERAELSPSRYIEDIEVLHNIRRREIVAKALYRESGQLFARINRKGESNPPLPPYLLISGASPLPPIKRNFETNPSMNCQERGKILNKIIGQKPHLESVSTGEERDPLWEKCVFAQECLRAHNLYRARHSAPPLQLCKKLCNLAQGWANHLAQTGRLRHRADPEYGENIFCRNVALAIKSQLTMPDITGEEVAAYWYSNVRQYRFSLADSALQAHAGSFSQMVWKMSEKFGIGKALSRSGKIIVVAHYYPPGNVSSQFRYNVLPLNTRALAAEMLCQGNALMEEALAQPDEEEINFQRALLNIGMGVSGVLAAQPPNITGRNATKILAAHMLGHAAAVVTTPDEKLDVVIVSRKSIKRKKSCSKPATETLSGSRLNSSPLERLAERLGKDDTSYQHVEKALKEIINMKLKQQESLSAPNILTSTGAERRPKLSGIKKVKFKSEENINFRDRSKAVQTSFSSENLSTEEGNLEISESRLSSPCLESEDETISGWSETTSSGFSNPPTNYKSSSLSDSTETVSTTCESKTKDFTTFSNSKACAYSSVTQDTSNTSERLSNSHFQSTDTSLSMAPLSSGEFNNPSYSSSNSPETVPEPVYTPKRCTIRRIPKHEEAFSSSQESFTSATSERENSEEEASSTESAKTEETQNTEEKDHRSGGGQNCVMNLPFDSPSREVGLLNCYALSPLHY